MLPTTFSFIWVLQMLIGYSTFLINIYLGILVFQLSIFVNIKTFLPIWYILCHCCYEHNMLLIIDFVLRSLLNKCWKPVSWLCTVSHLELKWTADSKVIKSSTHDYFIILDIKLKSNFFCYLLPLQINFICFFERVNTHANLGTVYLSPWCGQF